MFLAPDAHHWTGWPESTGRACVRAFGERAQDLDVDFGRTHRAELVNDVLRTCVQVDDSAWVSDRFWSWTLAQRLQALLAIARTSGVSLITLTQRCTACAEWIELPIELDRFEREERLQIFDWLPESTVRLAVALPTGQDQLAWSQAN